MADLVALQYILYGQKEYEAGDLLPSDAPEADEWVECGSAKWREETPATAPIAKPVTATPGLPGQAVGGGVIGNDLVGRIPPRAERT